MDIIFNYYEHYPFLFSEMPIKDKEQVVKLGNGRVVAIYKTTSGHIDVSAKNYYSLTEFEKREKIRQENCICMN